MPPQSAAQAARATQDWPVTYFDLSCLPRWTSSVYFATLSVQPGCRVLNDSRRDRHGQHLASPRALIPVMFLPEQWYDADTTPADRWGLRHDSRYRCHGCEARARDSPSRAGVVTVHHTPTVTSATRTRLPCGPVWKERNLSFPNRAAEGAPPRVSVRQPRLETGPTSLVGKCESG